MEHIAIDLGGKKSQIWRPKRFGHDSRRTIGRNESVGWVSEEATSQQSGCRNMRRGIFGGERSDSHLATRSRSSLRRLSDRWGSETAVSRPTRGTHAI